MKDDHLSCLLSLLPGCSFLFRAKLQELWGEHCSSCAYCLSTAKTVVSDFYRDKVEHFCSQECNTKYNKLLCHVSSGFLL